MSKIHIVSPDCVKREQVYDQYRSANIEKAHKGDVGSRFNVGLKMVVEEVINFLEDGYNIPEVIYTESSLIPERVGYSGKHLYDFIVICINKHKKQALRLRDKIYTAYEEVYPRLHGEGYTVFNVPDFFMSPKTIEAIATKYSADCNNQYTRDRVSYLKGTQSIRSSDEYQSEWEVYERKCCKYLFQRKVVLESGHEKGREEQEGEAERNASILHKYFHETAFDEYYNESLLLSVPVVGASSGRTNRLSGMGGLFIMLAYEERSDLDISEKEEKHICSVASQIMKDFFSPYLFSSATSNYKNRLKEERRSEIASIMARNMSHNIGSHVLASPELLEKPFDRVHKASSDSDKEIREEKGKVQDIHNFLQQRMDFIARIISYTPSWGEPMFFYRDLLDVFLSQELLLGYLVKDQGYGREDISFYVHYDGSCRRFEVSGSHSSTSQASVTDGSSTGSDIGDNALEDFLVAIPGGSIGAHAFYDILENVMRNSAKYGENRDKLEVHLDIDGNRYDDRYKITLWDNLSPSQMGTEDRVELVKNPLAEPLVDPRTGDTHTEGRGLQEVKECARLLAHPYAGKKSDATEESNDWTFEVESDGVTRYLPVNVASHSHDGQEYLGYEFYLQKPHLVGIACPGTSFCLDVQEREEAKEAGIYAYAGDENATSALESLMDYAHQFGVVWMPKGDPGKGQGKEVLEFIVKHHHLLPYRLLLAISRGQREALEQEIQETEGIPERRVHLCEKEQVRQIFDQTEEDWTRSVLDVYELWLQLFKPLRDGGKWQMVILFERGEDSVAFRNWRAGLKEFSFGVLDVHVVRFHREGDDSYFDEIEYSTSDLHKEGIIEQMAKDPGRFIVFDNHRKGLESLGQFGSEKESFACYHEFGLKHALKIYQSLESPPQDSFGAAYFALGLVESALANILLIDERVAEACFKNRDNKEDGLSADSFLYERLRNANIHPIFSAQTDACNKDIERIYISNSIEQTNKGLKNDIRPKELSEDEGLFLVNSVDNGISSYAKVHRSSHAQKQGVDSFRGDNGDKYGNIDIIVLHQGVLDRLSNLDPSRWRGEEDLRGMYTFSPSVVITSGRGRNLREGVTPKTIPFLEFSTIRQSTYAEISKFHLSRALFSVVGKLN